MRRDLSGGGRWWCGKCQMSFKDIIPLLWCWSQHWRNEYPAPQPDSAVRFNTCRRSALCVISKANIQLYFVNGSLEHGKTGKDRVCCACKCNQVRSIKTPNLVLFLVAVTFNTSRNLFKIRLLKARMEWQKWQQTQEWYLIGFCPRVEKGKLIVIGYSS